MVSSRERVNVEMGNISTVISELGISGNSSCKHFFTLLVGLVMVRKIKPQRTQRDTESCYFPLSPPLCPLCPLWFSETLFRKYQKVSDVLVTATQDTRDPELEEINAFISKKNNEEFPS
jgi:hypothetical protein